MPIFPADIHLFQRLLRPSWLPSSWKPICRHQTGYISYLRPIYHNEYHGHKYQLFKPMYLQKFFSTSVFFRTKPSLDLNESASKLPLFLKILGADYSDKFLKQSQNDSDTIVLYELSPKQSRNWKLIFFITPIVTLYIILSFGVNLILPEEKQEDIFKLKWKDGSIFEKVWVLNVSIISLAWIGASILSIKASERFVKMLEYCKVSHRLRAQLGLGKFLGVGTNSKIVEFSARDFGLFNALATYKPSFRERLVRARYYHDKRTRLAIFDSRGNFSPIWLDYYRDQSSEWEDAAPPEKNYPVNLWNTSMKYIYRPLRAFGDLFYFTPPGNRNQRIEILLRDKTDAESNSARERIVKGLDKLDVQRRVEQILRNRQSDWLSKSEKN